MPAATSFADRLSLALPEVLTYLRRRYGREGARQHACRMAVGATTDDEETFWYVVASFF